MDWVRLWHDMPNDPKWRAIARRSGEPITSVICVYVQMLVCASAANDRGNLDGWDDEDIAASLDLEPESVAAIRDAMEDKVVVGGRLTGWEKRQPKRNDDSAARVKKHRENKRRRHNPSDDVAGVTPCNAPDAESDTDIEPSLRSGSAQSDKSLNAGSNAGQQSTAIAASRAGRPDPVIERIPLNTGDDYPVTQSQIDEWQRLFPAVDVGQAVREMRAWSASNASRRKTRRGIERFATNWLSREQDKGASQPPGGPRGTNDSGHNAGRGQSSAAGFWEHFGSEAVGHG